MKLIPHHPDDLARLRERVSAERQALQRCPFDHPHLRADVLTRHPAEDGHDEGSDDGGRVAGAD
jgi:hypothetical protein